ncbi:hypothetical protein [Arthrobacter pascens]|nr:hypothetical protein [Arthrobacter pascens]
MMYRILFNQDKPLDGFAEHLVDKVFTLQASAAPQSALAGSQPSSEPAGK